MSMAMAMAMQETVACPKHATIVELVELQACPAGQSTPDHTAPKVSMSHPVAQEVQFHCDVAPSGENGASSGHLAHSAAPTTLLKRPRGHSSHVPFKANVPSPQSTWEEFEWEGRGRDGVKERQWLRNVRLTGRLRTFVCVIALQTCPPGHTQSP